MYALAAHQTEQVHGGAVVLVLPYLVGAFSAIWGGASSIEDFAEGFAEGWAEKRIEKTGK